MYCAACCGDVTNTDLPLPEREYEFCAVSTAASDVMFVMRRKACRQLAPSRPYRSAFSSPWKQLICVIFSLTEAYWRVMKQRYLLTSLLSGFPVYFHWHANMNFCWVKTVVTVYNVFRKKRPTLILAHNLAKCSLIFKILSSPHSAVIVKNIIWCQTQRVTSKM